MINHNPICSCPVGQTGDPFVRCLPLPRKIYLCRINSDALINNIYTAPPVDVKVPTDPCVPSPCGPYSQCRNIGNTPSCSCLVGYVGFPPQCRPECTINTECPSHLACIREKCMDPCPGSCGINAKCSVINHTPICVCPTNYEGDPFNHCNIKIPPQRKKIWKEITSVIYLIIYFSTTETWSMLSITLWIKCCL